MKLKQKFTGKSLKVSWNLEINSIPSDKQSQVINGLIETGIDAILVKAARKGEPEDNGKRVRQRLAALQTGTFDFNPKRASRQTPTEKAWVLYLNGKGIKEGGAEITGKNLDRAQHSLCRSALLNEHPAGSEERKEIERNLGAMVEARFDEWKTSFEESEPPLKMAIEFQKMMASAEMSG